MGKQWLVVLGAVGLALLACSGGSSLPDVDVETISVEPPPPPPPPPPVQPPEEVVQAPQGPGQRHPFTCCDTRSKPGHCSRTAIAKKQTDIGMTLRDEE